MSKTEIVRFLKEFQHPLHPTPITHPDLKTHLASPDEIAAKPILLLSIDRYLPLWPGIDVGLLTSVRPSPGVRRPLTRLIGYSIIFSPRISPPLATLKSHATVASVTAPSTAAESWSHRVPVVIAAPAMESTNCFHCPLFIAIAVAAKGPGVGAISRGFGSCRHGTNYNNSCTTTDSVQN